MASLQGKTVVVTGAGSGIGAEAAVRFAREGARLVVADRDGDRARETASRIEALGGEAEAVRVDVRDRAQVESMVGAAVERFGRVDVLVNNAGYGLGATVEQTSAEDFRELFETNVLGVLYGMQAVLPVMRGQGGGHIINVSSAAGRIAFPGIGAYSATKAAVAALTEALRVEEADAGIRASVVFPIGTRTRFFSDARLIDATSSVGPHGPTQTAEHVAGRIVACAKRPTPEVLPFRPLRAGMVLKALFPSLFTYIGRRAYREQLRRTGKHEGASAQQEKEATHG